MAKEKVVLAYSGGLDTTAIIPWLKETYDYDVVCCCVDVGQESELEGLDERAKYSGAEKLYIEDVVDELCDEYIMPTVKAGAIYENKYLLGTSFARPVIAKKLVEIARKEGAVAICHGATGKGNDQLRFELSIKALAPDIKVIATWRQPEWTMQSREDEIDFCKAHGIDLPFDASHSYSRDRNIWHISHEGLELESPSLAPNYDDLLVLSVTPQNAPDEAEDVEIDFEAGVPVALNGKRMKVSDIIRELNRLGGKHGIELHLTCTCYCLLCLVNKCRHAFTKRCEPLSFIYKISKFDCHHILVSKSLSVKANFLKLLVCFHKDCSTWCLVYTT